MAWFVDNDLKLKANVADALTDEPISKVIKCGEGTSPLVVDVKVASGTGTIKLQDSSDGFTTANTKAKTVSVSGAGTFSITLLPELSTDQANYPLRNSLRIVMTTTSAVVIDEIRVLVER